MAYFSLSILLIAIDQLVKYLVRVRIPYGGMVPFIPHVLGLTHVQNPGAAFSLFGGHTWILTIVSAVVTVALIFLLARRVFVTHTAGRICLAVVLAGAAGNLIDRVAFGSVTDMFAPLFIDFAIFNVADVCLVLGGIALCAYILFFHERLEGRG